MLNANKGFHCKTLFIIIMFFFNLQVKFVKLNFVESNVVFADAFSIFLNFI